MPDHLAIDNITQIAAQHIYPLGFQSDADYSLAELRALFAHVAELSTALIWAASDIGLRIKRQLESECDYTSYRNRVSQLYQELADIHPTVRFAGTWANYISVAEVVPIEKRSPRLGPASYLSLVPSLRDPAQQPTAADLTEALSRGEITVREVREYMAQQYEPVDVPYYNPNGNEEQPPRSSPHFRTVPVAVETLEETLSVLASVEEDRASVVAAKIEAILASCETPPCNGLFGG